MKNLTIRTVKQKKIPITFLSIIFVKTLNQFFTRIYSRLKLFITVELSRPISYEVIESQ